MKPPSSIQTEPIPVDAAREGGVSRRVVLLCLALAGFFGYVIPMVDIRLQNSFHAF